MAAHTESHHAPDRQLVAFEDVARRVARVLRAQRHLATDPVQALAQRLAVDRRDDDMPVARLQGAVDDHQVAVEDPGALHAVAVYPDQVHVRRTQVEQVVQ